MGKTRKAYGDHHNNARPYERTREKLGENIDYKDDQEVMVDEVEETKENETH